MPNNTFRFYFSSHGSGKDALAMRDDFDWCTTFCPEGTGSTETHRDVYTFLSVGLLNAQNVFEMKQPPGDAFDFFQFCLMEGSHKRIEILDVPYGLPVTGMLDFLVAALLYVGTYHRPFWEVHDAFLHQLFHFVEGNRVRERHMLDEVRRLEDTLTDERVLVRLGTSHFRLAGQAAAAGLTVEKRFRSQHFHLFTLCYHYLSCGRAVPVSISSRFVFGQLLRHHTWLDRTVYDFNERERILWHTTRRFRIHGMQVLWEQCQENPIHASSILLDALRRKDLA